MADKVVVSIFINKAQFGPDEDFDQYPRSLDADLDQLKALGVDVVFTPSFSDFYPNPNRSTKIHVPDLSSRYCGQSRPVFFDGITSVVLRLFHCVSPTIAIFGEKDYQQYVIIQKMTTDLLLPIEIVSSPIIREENGLALSSRNAYLSESEKDEAASIYKSLTHLQSMFQQGEIRSQSLIETFKTGLSSLIKLDYIHVVDSHTLDEKEMAQSGDRVLVAGGLGETRLIDNISL